MCTPNALSKVKVPLFNGLRSLHHFERFEGGSRFGATSVLLPAPLLDDLVVDQLRLNRCSRAKS